MNEKSLAEMMSESVNQHMESWIKVKNELSDLDPGIIVRVDQIVFAKRDRIGQYDVILKDRPESFVQACLIDATLT